MNEGMDTAMVELMEAEAEARDMATTTSEMTTAIAEAAETVGAAGGARAGVGRPRVWGDGTVAEQEAPDATPDSLDISRSHGEAHSLSDLIEKGECLSGTD